MTKTYTDIIVLLDNSSSMRNIAKETVSSFNEFIESQASLDADDCRVSLYQFATKSTPSYCNKAINNVNPLVLSESYIPNGMSTSLLDAIGDTVINVGKEYAVMSEEERPNKVVFVIITDGQENSSRKFNRNKINEMINHQKDKYNWNFIFLGANQDAITTGASLGISSEDSLSYGYTGKGISLATQSLDTKISFMRTTGAMPAFASADRAAQYAEGAVFHA